MPGVLDGLQILELAGIGPAPFAAMMLADHGARVIRIEKPGIDYEPMGPDVLRRTRSILRVDIKTEEGRNIVERLLLDCDGLIEGYRPGVLERLGLSPDKLIARKPSLVVGRMTGWGQTGPNAIRAGHDINYIALTGLLHACGPAEGPPVIPLNLAGDFGGGGMLMAFGMVSAILQAKLSGRGQVIDCAMIDGASLLFSMIRSFYNAGEWQDRRGVNALDGGAHFYAVYETADGRFLAVGAIEPQFYKILLDILGLADDPMADQQLCPEEWPHHRRKIAEIIATRNCDDWCALLENTDACVTPVLSISEAPTHPHHLSRHSFFPMGPGMQAAPAPRFSVTPAAAPTPAGLKNSTKEVLHEIGLTDAALARLHRAGVIDLEPEPSV